MGLHWKRFAPFIFLHTTLALPFFVGVTPTAVFLCVASYVLRMFAITAFYHRYFSHKSFKTKPWVETLFAAIGASACQRGPIWWASMHRNHHKHSDQKNDPHGSSKGFIWIHFKWFLVDQNYATDDAKVKDLLKSPTLVFIDRFDLIFPVLFFLFTGLLGFLLSRYGFEITILQAVVWGFFIPTVLAMHATFCVNSVCHKWGSRRFPTKDQSRNNGLVALLTLGEGWHNNHHFAPGTAKQGFKKTEIDLCYLTLKLMSFFNLVWDLKPVPEHVVTFMNKHNHTESAGMG